MGWFLFAGGSFQTSYRVHIHTSDYVISKGTEMDRHDIHHIARFYALCNINDASARSHTPQRCNRHSYDSRRPISISSESRRTFSVSRLVSCHCPHRPSCIVPWYKHLSSKQDGSQVRSGCIIWIERDKQGCDKSSLSENAFNRLPTQRNCISCHQNHNDVS